MIIIVKLFMLYILFITIFLCILLLFDYTHWNGIEKKNDDTIQDKILNRLYFITTTVSTSGYGDITPKSKVCRIIIMVLQTFVLFGIIDALQGISSSK